MSQSESQLNPKQEQLLSYLYDELSTGEKMVVKQELKTDSDLAREFKGYLQLRSLVQEHLPHQKVPPGLASKVLQELGLKKPWYAFLTEGFWRPALVGAFALAMVLGVGSRFPDLWQGEGTSPQAIKVAAAPSGQRFNLAPLNKNLGTSGSFAPQFNLAPPQPQAAAGWVAGGRPQQVAYGNSMKMDPQVSNLSETKLYHMELEAQQAMAQFVHQQALRLRAVGDNRGAADQLSHLIKTYPFYPYKLHAMAQRVDLLFRDGATELAQKELTILRELSPKLAYLVERRWQ